jgi:YVTN family beta-propeller protein
VSLNFVKKHMRALRNLAVFCTFVAAPAVAGTVHIYVTNHAGTTIDIIDSATNKIVGAIKDTEVPEAVHFSRDGGQVYITNGANPFLTVLDRKTGDLIKKIPMSGNPNDMTVSPDGKLILVAITDSPGALDIFDTSSLEKVKSIRTEGRVHDVVVSKDGNYAVTTSPEKKSVTVFDLKRGEIAWDVTFDQRTQVAAIESNHDGSPRRIFVELLTLDGFAVIDFAKRKEVDRITFPDDLPRTVPGGSQSHGMDITPDGKNLWVVSRGYSAAFVYSLPDLGLVGHVHLPWIELSNRSSIGGSPNWVVFTPDGKTAYVANGGDRSVSAIDVKTLKPLVRIPAGEQPGRMGVLQLP